MVPRGDTCLRDGGRASPTIPPGGSRIQYGYCRNVERLHLNDSGESWGSVMRRIRNLVPLAIVLACAIVWVGCQGDTPTGPTAGDNPLVVKGRNPGHVQSLLEIPATPTWRWSPAVRTTRAPTSR